MDTGRPGRGGKTRGDADGTATATAEPGWEVVEDAGGGGTRQVLKGWTSWDLGIR